MLLQRWPRDARYISGSNESLGRPYDHSKLSKMAACHQVGFDVTANSAIRSADPENPTLEPKMKCIGSPVAEIWPFAYLGAYGTPICGRGGRRGSAMAPFERAMVVSYRLSVVTVALCVPFGRNLQSNVSNAQINRGWVTLGQNLGVFPLEQTRQLGLQRASVPC